VERLTKPSLLGITDGKDLVDGTSVGLSIILSEEILTTVSIAGCTGRAEKISENLEKGIYNKRKMR
tara:strand:- start:644 stop:841 length:198 start_codon:yes stop_codon:yes gene_type:complete